MQRDFSSSIRLLEQHLQDHHQDWGVRDLAPAGAGVDFLVLRGTSKKFGPVVFRIPHSPWISHLNDPLIEARQLLQQESIIASYLAAHGIPTPQVYALCLNDDGFDFLMSAYIKSDGSEPDPYQFGELMRSIHNLPPPSLRLVMQTHTTVVDSIIERLLRRSHLIEKLFKISLNMPDITKIVTVMRAYYKPASLLHMDARSTNILSFRGEIFSIIDWGNALVGDPAFELARIAEYGYVAQDGVLDRNFVAGYGGVNILNELPDEVECLYRLDSATMLTVLFACLLSDPVQAQKSARRVIALYQQLNYVLGEQHALKFCPKRV